MYDYDNTRMTANDRLYLLKIRLLYIEPEIMRRFVVPGNISLDRLHDVIQIVMGWKDCHLHEFSIGKKRYAEHPESKEQGVEECKHRLGDLMKQKGRTFNYTYDFGDSWEHEIVLEDSRYSNSDLQSRIECLEGTGACPPEDVGGLPGYYAFRDALKDPNNEEHETYKEWFADSPMYDGAFDSEKFDIEKVNYELTKYLRWSRYRFFH